MKCSIAMRAENGQVKDAVVGSAENHEVVNMQNSGGWCVEIAGCGSKTHGYSLPSTRLLMTFTRLVDKLPRSDQSDCNLVQIFDFLPALCTYPLILVQ